MFLYLLLPPLMSFIILLSFLSSLLHSFTSRSCFLFSFIIVLCRVFIGFSISPSFVFRSISFFFLYLCIFLYIFLLLYLIFAKSILGVVCFSFFLSSFLLHLPVFLFHFLAFFTSYSLIFPSCKYNHTYISVLCYLLPSPLFSSPALPLPFVLV